MVHFHFTLTLRAHQLEIAISQRYYHWMIFMVMAIWSLCKVALRYVHLLLTITYNGL